MFTVEVLFQDPDLLSAVRLGISDHPCKAQSLYANYVMILDTVKTHAVWTKQTSVLRKPCSAIIAEMACAF